MIAFILHLVNRSSVKDKPGTPFVKKSLRELNQKLILKGDLSSVDIAKAYLVMQEIHDQGYCKFDYNGQMIDLLNAKLVTYSKDKPADIAKMLNVENYVMISKQFLLTLPQINHSGLY